MQLTGGCHEAGAGRATLITPAPCVQVWTRIMKDVANDPWMAASVIFDFLNEPGAAKLTWGPNGSQLNGKGLGYWYHKIMDVSYGINPRAIHLDSLYMAVYRLNGSCQQTSFKPALSDLNRCFIYVRRHGTERPRCQLGRRFCH